MKTGAVMGVVVLVLGCGGKKKDDCTRLYEKMASFMPGMPMPEGDRKSDAEKQFLAECRSDPAKYIESPEGKCVLAADSDVDAAKCMDTMKKSKKSEASTWLNTIAKNAKAYYAATASFPKGEAATLPDGNGAAGCCGGSDNKCKMSSAWANDPVWSELEVQINEPTQYRYSYESTDGQSFTATAIADLDCDRREATWTLAGTVSGGIPTTNLEPPPKGTY